MKTPMRISVALLLFLPALATALPIYTVTEVGPAQSVATGLNDLGQVVGYFYSGGYSVQQSFVYADGRTTLLSQFGYGEPADINNSGQVALSIFGSRTAASIYDVASGVLAKLDTGGRTSYTGGINVFGQVAGSWTDSAFRSSAFVFSGGVTTNIGTLGGSDAWAVDINDSGQVAGWSSTVVGNFNAFLYFNGNMMDLGNLGGTNTYTYGMNNKGEVVGYSSTGKAFNAFLYSDGKMVNLGTFGGSSSYAYAINDAGQVVGQAMDASENIVTFLWNDGVMLSLNDLIEPSSGWQVGSVLDINNKGQIAATGVKDGITHALLLTPNARSTPPVEMPEPSMVGLVLSGLMTIGIMRRRIGATLRR